LSVSGALFTTGLAVVASVITAFVTARLQASAELRKWQQDIKLSYAQAASTDVELARQIATQFAIGFVKFIDTDDRKRFFIPANIRMTLGRDPACDIVISDSRASWKHSSLQSDNAAVYVEDFGTTNGTFVNDKRVDKKVRLADKDIIRIGDMRLQYWSLMKKPA